MFLNVLATACVATVCLLAAADCHAIPIASAALRPSLQDVNGWIAFGGGYEHTGFKNDSYMLTKSYQQVWNVTASDNLKSPVIYNNTVYAVTQSGVLYSYNEATGKLIKLWNLGGNSDIGPATVDVYNGQVYVQAIGSSEGITVFALDTEKLRVKWTAGGDSQWATYPYGVAVSNSTGLVYYPGGEYNGEMYGVNAKTGAQKFDSLLYPTGAGGDGWAPAVYQDKRVFFATGPGEGNNGLVGEADATTGKTKWSYNIMSSTIYSTGWVPVVARDTVLGVAFSSNFYSVVAVDINNSHDGLWTSDNCRFNGGDATPATDGSQVYLACADGVHAYDLSDGTPQTVYVPCDGCFGQPIVTANYVYVRSKNSGVRVFHKTSATLVDQFLTNTKIDNFAYHNGTIIVTSGSSLMAFQAN